MEESHKGPTDLVVYCTGGSLPAEAEYVDNTQSEGNLLQSYGLA